MRATNTPSFLVLCVAYHVVFALVSSHDHHHHHRGLPPVFVRANQPVVRFRNKTGWDPRGRRRERLRVVRQRHDRGRRGGDHGK